MAKRTSKKPATRPKRPKPKAARPAATPRPSKPARRSKRQGAIPEHTAVPSLLAGGNPRIPKSDGDAPVQAYIAAMPDWKRATGRRLDALITRAFPGVRKAVKWNSPFYGAGDLGWFLSFHCFTNYIKVAFFNGSSLTPPPPGGSKSPTTRYLDVRERDEIDEAQFKRWVKQASRLPGWGGS